MPYSGTSQTACSSTIASRPSCRVLSMLQRRSQTGRQLKAMF
jgi:hypothetical protein